jgi:group I intron endonuclease
MIVYLITNTANGKRYVGITTHSISKRWPEHCFLARTHAKQALYRAIRKHGISCFSIREIDTADTLDELKKKERHYIEYFGTYTKTGHGYNMTLGEMAYLVSSLATKLRSRWRKPVPHDFQTRLSGSARDFGNRHSGQRGNARNTPKRLPMHIGAILSLLGDTPTS